MQKKGWDFKESNTTRVQTFMCCTLVRKRNRFTIHTEFTWSFQSKNHADLYSCCCKFFPKYRKSFRFEV